MSIELPNPADWLARLQEQAPNLAQVGQWQALDDVMTQGVARSPAAFVIPVNELAEGSTTVQGVMQRVTCTWTVLLAIRNLRAATGASQTGDLITLRQDIMAALLGWTWGDTQITFARGQQVGLADGVLWWADEYEFETYLRVV